jgi:putative SOS response-associated peptidase YedK
MGSGKRRTPPRRAEVGIGAVFHEEAWIAPDGETLQTFSTITTEANRRLSTIQPRMPLIIAPADWPIWLGETEGDVGALLRPAPEDVLRVWPVNKKVGNVKNDGPKLLEPHASAEEMPALL